MTRKMIATITAFAIGMMMIVMGASPATATTPGDSATNPIVVANPSDVPEGAVEDEVSTYITAAECDTTRSWVLTTKGNEDTTHKEWGTEERVRTKTVIPAVTKDVKVVDSPAVWANWAPNDTQGPQNYEPIWPEDERGKWIVHEQGIPPGHEGPDGVYQKGEGNSPYFYRQAEVSHIETVVVTPERTEYGEWGPWTTRTTGELSEPVLPANTDVHEYRVTGPVEVSNNDGTDDVVTYYAWTDGKECDTDEPTETTAAAPTFHDPCGVTRDRVILPEDDRPEVQYDISYREEGNATVTVVEAYVPEEYADEYVLTGKTVWEYIFDDIGCPDGPKADRGADIVNARTSSYQCGDNFKTVTTITWTTPWMLLDNGEKMYGDTIKTVEKDRVKTEVVPCKTDKPEPKTPVATPDKPCPDEPNKDTPKTSPEVPTSVDAGLVSAEPQAKKKSFDSDFDLDDFPLWVVILFLVIVGAVLLFKFFTD